MTYNIYIEVFSMACIKTKIFFIKQLAQKTLIKLYIDLQCVCSHFILKFESILQKKKVQI